MRCLHCDKEIPADAVFCIYCGTQIPRAREVQVNEAAAPAATGPTINLSRKPAATPPPAAAAPQPSGSHSYPQQPWPFAGQNAAPRRCGSHKLGFWLLVLGVFLFFATLRGGWGPGMGLFFGLPGILLIVGLVAFSRHNARGKHDEALRTLVWLGGLALLFATGFFWPGILLLLGVMTLLRPQHRRWC